MEHWAKLSESHILRLGELTKREIQVICYLFLKRNGSNNKCNPKRKTIAEGTGIGRSHVTEALAGLVAKCWVDENLETGDFVLHDAAEIPVPKSGTKFPNREQENTVPKSGTDVPKSGKLVPKSGAAYKGFKQTSNRELTDKARAPRKTSIATRIPDPFPLTDEMVSWFTKNVPTLRIGPIAAHENFVEYWTNKQGKKSVKPRWDLAWKTGMRLLLKWQIRDDAAAGIANGAGSDWRTVGKHDGSEPDDVLDLADCIVCNNSRRVDDEPGSEYSTLHYLPCPVCFAEQHSKMKSYNDEFRRRLAAGLSLKNLNSD